uniref:Mitochondrial import inner membrane translocase subunit TIM22 n=1 Tax=Ditylenchus dipsaci TaxID=166011 RepID=A0A915E2S0_9BILA
MTTTPFSQGKSVDLDDIFGNPFRKKREQQEIPVKDKNPFVYTPSAFAQLVDEMIARQMLTLPQLSREEKIMHGVMENCLFKSVLSGVLGAGIGVLFGLFTAGVDPNVSINKDPLKVPGFKETVREMRGRMSSYSKSFGSIGLCSLARNALWKASGRRAIGGTVHILVQL